MSFFQASKNAQGEDTAERLLNIFMVKIIADSLKTAGLAVATHMSR